MKYTDKELHARVMVDADLFFLTEWLMDPVVLGWFPMSNLKEVQDASKVWQIYARKNAAFTVEVNGAPAGMAIVYVNTYEKIKHQSLFAIVVGEKYRGKGVGAYLLKYIMKKARDEFGIWLLHLEVYQDNPAYRLYHRLGFREYGKHEKFLKEADGRYETKVMMQIDLNTVEL